MARLPRYFVPRAAQHVIQRGNDRKAIFVAEDDYVAYLDWLKQAARDNGLDIHAYVLMTNHVHLLATPQARDSIGATFQSLGRRYVRYFNFTYQRTGTLWEGRYRATVVDTEPYLLVCSRYIEWNPVRAMMVPSADTYRWSSYRYNAMGAADELITEHPLYTSLGSTRKQRSAAYLALFQGILDEQKIADIREATNKGWALGDDRFRAEIEALTARRAQPMPRGRKRKVGAERS